MNEGKHTQRGRERGGGWGMVQGLFCSHWFGPKPCLVSCKQVHFSFTFLLLPLENRTDLASAWTDLKPVKLSSLTSCCTKKLFIIIDRKKLYSSLLEYPCLFYLRPLCARVKFPPSPPPAFILFLYAWGNHSNGAESLFRACTKVRLGLSIGKFNFLHFLNIVKASNTLA